MPLLSLYPRECKSVYHKDFYKPVLQHSSQKTSSESSQVFNMQSFIHTQKTKLWDFFGGGVKLGGTGNHYIKQNKYCMLSFISGIWIY